MPQITLKRIRFFLVPLWVWLLSALLISSEAAYQIANPHQQKITLRLAITPDEQQKGLSGLRPSQFKDNEGMLFINAKPSSHRFWMPDTYFNLDIIFLNQDLSIIGLEKNVPAHPGMKEPPAIYRTKEYFCQYILETKANSLFSKKLTVGEKLKWAGTTSLSEITLKTHR